MSFKILEQTLILSRQLAQLDESNVLTTSSHSIFVGQLPEQKVCRLGEEQELKTEHSRT
jgi:hypothetical protein